VRVTHEQMNVGTDFLNRTYFTVITKLSFDKNNDSLSSWLTVWANVCDFPQFLYAKSGIWYSNNTQILLSQSFSNSHIWLTIRNCKRKSVTK